MTSVLFTAVLIIFGHPVLRADDGPVQPVVVAFSQSTATQIIDSLSPLPEEPTIRGHRFRYWHLLRHIRDGMQGWLNSDDPERYSFSNVRALSPDPLRELNYHRRLYEAVRRDYLELLENGRIDLMDLDEESKDWKPWPYIQKLRFDLANFLFENSLSVSKNFSNLLTLFHRPLVDTRHFHSFFFHTWFDRDHIPLENFSSLGQASRIAPQVIERLQDTFSSEVERIHASAAVLAEKVARLEASSVDLPTVFRETESFIQHATEVQFRLVFASESLYQAAQVANDIVRDKKVDDIETLEARIVALGDGLRYVLTAVENYRKGDVAGRWVNQGDATVLRWPYDDLDRILYRAQIFTGFTLPDTFLRRSGKDLAYQMYTDTLIAQYVLCASGIMAKISELAEQRGGALDRLGQELRFRTAQLGARVETRLGKGRTQSGKPSIPEAGATTPDQKSVTLAVINKESHSMPHRPQRRDFVTPSTKSARDDTETRLWRVFFQHAGLNVSVPAVVEACFLFSEVTDKSKPQP